MADRDSMSVEEMIAACRAADGGASGAEAPPEPAAAAEAPEPSETPGAATADAPAKAGPAAKQAPKSPSGRPSVAEMLAMARGEQGGQDSDSAAEESSAGPAKSSPSAGPAKGAASKAGAAGGGRPSVADMMAMARGEKSAAAKPDAKAKPAPKKGGAAKPPAGKKPAAAKGASKQTAGPKDTASILAAARKPVQPGPMSKAEAAARGDSAASKGADSKGAGPKRIVAPPMPEKPAYAQPEPAAVAETGAWGRRSVVLAMIMGSFLALGFSTFAATMGLWTLAFARFMFPNILREPPSQFKVGFPGQFAPGQVETKFKAQFGVWVISGEYEGESQIFALKSVCTHLGCTPNWLEAEQKFKCPCHGSGFYKDGINFEGPAPRPLERYAIAIADDGQLLIDKSRTFQQERGDWNDPASFVSV